jgi:hypothetical protein
MLKLTALENICVTGKFAPVEKKPCVTWTCVRYFRWRILVAQITTRRHVATKAAAHSGPRRASATLEIEHGCRLNARQAARSVRHQVKLFCAISAKPIRNHPRAFATFSNTSMHTADSTSTLSESMQGGSGSSISASAKKAEKPSGLKWPKPGQQQHVVKDSAKIAWPSDTGSRDAKQKQAKHVQATARKEKLESGKVTVASITLTSRHLGKKKQEPKQLCSHALGLLSDLYQIQ